MASPSRGMSQRVDGTRLRKAPIRESGRHDDGVTAAGQGAARNQPNTAGCARACLSPPFRRGRFAARFGRRAAQAFVITHFKARNIFRWTSRCSAAMLHRERGWNHEQDRKNVVWGRRVSVSVVLGGRGCLKKNNSNSSTK